MTRRNFIPTGNSGEAATLANTGASQVLVATPNTITLSSTAGFLSGLGVRITHTGSGNGQTRYALAAPTDSARFRIPIRPISRTSGQVSTIGQVRNNGGQPLSGQFITNAAGNLIWRPISGADTTFTTVLAIGTNYEISIPEIVGNSETAGRLTVNVYNESTGALLETKNIVNQNLGLGQFTHLQMLGPVTSAQSFEYGVIQADDTAGAELPAYVPAATGDVRPISGAGTGDAGWTVYGDAADLGSALRDSNRTTGIESPDITATPTERIFTYPPMTVRQQLSATVDDTVLTTSTGTAQIKLYKGTTLIATKALTATTTAADRTVTFTSAEVTAIGSTEADWSNLRVGLRTVA